jgi:hypothetical protein
VFSRAVDAGERFLVQQRLETVSERHAPQRRHHEHVVIDGKIGFLEIRRHLELAGRDFIVAGGNRHSELVQLELCFGNASLDALRNSAEIVILQLLSTRRWSADEGTASHHEIRAHPEVRAIDEEIFLLGSQGREDALHSLVAE